MRKTIEDLFNEFIETGILDENEYQEYEICITEFDNKIIKGETMQNNNIILQGGQYSKCMKCKGEEFFINKAGYLECSSCGKVYWILKTQVRKE